ncbi:single-stranded DNA-binding protein [Enterococcus casseliflavus]|uniref:single-stranded DNA-binding protein n=1 Tax=Enterococcus casseliflavus TaxID=37734 RepID=UPI00115F2702|nr:single-stranded DNA-binding protein [Enterococcus casseliflavus]MDT2980422.1 single-stranded DNA-binding protein [Enterococcus casseliflavus]MEB6212820.1 single-stranded DNA-binding protein [Enterococcus casseliflavus]
MINNVTLQGKLGKDIDLKYTQSGKAVGTTSIAVERDFKNVNGEKETDWVNIVFWGKTAETVANYFRKGDEILVVGRIQTRSYEDNSGGRKYVTEVVADKFSFTTGRKSQNTKDGGVTNNQRTNNANAQQNRNNVQSDPFSNSSIDIDDSLPF